MRASACGIEAVGSVKPKRPPLFCGYCVDYDGARRRLTRDELLELARLRRKHSDLWAGRKL